MTHGFFGTLMESGFSWLIIVVVYALCAAIGYLLGSVNWAIILTRLFHNNEDIRDHGSGNAGMTNVLRTVGKVPAALTFAGDFLKCVIACLLAWGVVALFGFSDPVFTQIGRFIAGVTCVLGHMFPVFYGFKGGKSVVTSAAMMCMTDWRVFLLILATFGLVFLAKRIISLASVVCAGMYPVYAFLVTFLLEYSHGTGMGSLWYLIFVTVLALLVGLLVLWKHRANIDRLRKGEEKPITAKKKG